MRHLVCVIFEEKDGLAKLTLNRPDHLNAIDSQTLADFDIVCDVIEASDSIKVLIICGAGRAFCSGADLEQVKSVSSDPAGLEAFVRSLMRGLTRIEAVPVPTIAAIHGYAFAGGFELGLCCDMRILADNAIVGDQHLNYGILPGVWRLPKVVGVARAKEILLTGAWLTSAEAERLGYANQVVPANGLMAAAEAMAAKLLDKSRPAARATKRLINLGMQAEMPEALELELLTEVQANIGGEDVAEGLQAFREKRKPVFRAR